MLPTLRFSGEGEGKEIFLVVDYAVADDALVGESLGHHRVAEKAGAGGRGVVFKAEDIHLHHFVALKFLPGK